MHLEIPYISKKNADKDLKLRTTVDDKGPVGKRIKDAVISKGKPLILEKVRVWVQSMARGSPIKDELENKKPLSSPSPSVARTTLSLSLSTSTTTALKNETLASTKKKKGVKSFRCINEMEINKIQIITSLASLNQLQKQLKAIKKELGLETDDKTALTSWLLY
ncbi:uncharacterized protein LOC106754614 [Vigna radiata var. radiata]|uniref:Uncharacterized protein LOC106754614 n=1 Tax=Vigna radiata var. radiata TaxID=3916 RepID=A0A1S3TEE0_VIGRR|nr:uncharacterized protein LOC106754614 [Vigna radiata var. radiata]